MTILRVTRREFIASLGSAAAWPMVARGQQPPKLFHIGYLGYSPPPLEQNLVAELRQGLRSANAESAMNGRFSLDDLVGAGDERGWQV